MASTNCFAVIASALALAGCQTPTAEFEILPPPEVPVQAPPALVDRSISGQVFWISEGREIVTVSGARVQIFDARYLSAVRDLIGHYSAQEFDTENAVYAGSAGRIMRAKMRLRQNVDDAWDSLDTPVVAVITDAEGRFSVSGKLPIEIGIVCQADKSIYGPRQTFRWAVTEDQISDTSRIILTNANRLP